MTDFTLDRRQLLAASAAAALTPAAAAGAPPASGPIAFAEREIRAAGAAAPKVRYRIVPGMAAQAYRFEGRTGDILVSAGDAAGAMYGGLDIAEAVRTGGTALTELLADGAVRTPYIAERGIKFNIPLDLRTPSYADGGHSNRANISEVWEQGFWRDYLDAMARSRLNVLTLWSLHPFPSMVKVPEFADIALDDVWRSRAPLGPAVFNSRGVDAVPDKFLNDHEVVKRITIDEKIAFWRDVMRMARDRGIKTYIITWNVYTYGVFGKHGITDDMSNPTTIAYLRASVRELVRTYPDLAGIGITAGENMGPHAGDAAAKERWLWATYGEGVRDALRGQPDRNVQLIHRFHQTEGDTINEVWKDYPGYPDTFKFSHKYSVAHMYSNPRPKFFDREARPALSGKQSWLTVRNDDIYSFRWGDPDFAREYVVNMPGRPVLAGFYMGPDGFCWGRDFLDRDLAGAPASARPLVIEKHWYSFAMWGRLAFDPRLPNSRFVAMLAARFPGVDAARLFGALRAASQVIPQTTSFFWRSNDLRWLPEACVHSAGWGIKRDRAEVGAVFYTVEDFINGEAAPDTGILNIRDWRSKLTAGEPLPGKTPLAVADAIAGSAAEAARGLDATRATLRGAPARELEQTLSDIEAMSHLGRYYAGKIRGACALALFDKGGSPQQQAAAIRHLEDAAEAWKRYAAAHARHYLPNFYSRIGYVDLRALTASAEADVAMARGWQPGRIA